MQGITYSVDIALCIDATGSMGSIVDKVKSNALKFYDDLSKHMLEKGKTIDVLRIRVIAFRDFYVDGDKAIATTDFLTLPQDLDKLSSFVNTIKADGGGDEPENGLEALTLAMKSEWSKIGDKRRQIIVFWTDASAHHLDKNADKKPPNYPSDMPGNFDDITDIWEGQSLMSMSAKRLILYAPDTDPWTDIATHWTNVIHYPSRAGDGLAAVDYQEILNAIANSV